LRISIAEYKDRVWGRCVSFKMDTPEYPYSKGLLGSAVFRDRGEKGAGLVIKLLYDHPKKDLYSSVRGGKICMRMRMSVSAAISSLKNKNSADSQDKDVEIIGPYSYP
jgi:hypothetical protein